MNVIFVVFLLYKHLRLSFVSVVLDFNASLIVVAPLSLILLPDDFVRIERLECAFHFCILVRFCAYNSDSVF